MTRPQTLAVVALVVGIAIAAALLYAAGRTAEAAVVGLGAGAAAVGRATARKRDRRAVVKAEVRAVEQLAERGRTLETDTARFQREARTSPKGETPEQRRDRLQRLADEAARKRGGR